MKFPAKEVRMRCLVPDLGFCVEVKKIAINRRNYRGPYCYAMLHDVGAKAQDMKLQLEEAGFFCSTFEEPRFRTGLSVDVPCGTIIITLEDSFEDYEVRGPYDGYRRWEVFYLPNGRWYMYATPWEDRAPIRLLSEEEAQPFEDLIFEGQAQ